MPTRLSLLIALWALLAGPGAAPAMVPEGAVHVMTVDEAITGATTSYVTGALERATAAKAECLVIKLDTPGGLLDATRDIVQAILNSKLPVVVYIAPSGARGASAGTMITLASHVAAMAPATHIGAAHPVSLFGGGGDEVMNEKILQDTSAYVESIAELRGRNVEWAISAVRESKSVPASRALELGVIEIVADDMDHLVEQLDGREVRLDRETTVMLHTVGKPRVNQDMSVGQSLLSLVSDPNLLFFLLALGVIGLYIEFSNPGLILPGVVGAISLLLALIAMQTLPVSYGSLGLILLGVALLVAEAFVPSFGILGIGGIASLLFGSLFLLDPAQTNLQVSRPLVFVTVGLIGIIALVVGRLILRSFRTPPRSMQARMVGDVAEVRTAIGPEAPGRVMLHGELWRAVADEAIPAGQRVVVQRVEGLTLHVAPEPPEDSAQQEGEPATGDAASQGPA